MAFEKKKKGFFGRLSERIGDVILARPTIDEDFLDELEEILITSDIGMETTMTIIERLRSDLKHEYLREPQPVSYTHLSGIWPKWTFRIRRVRLSPKFFAGYL